jgi:hypothetical protein
LPLVDAQEKETFQLNEDLVYDLDSLRFWISINDLKTLASRWRLNMSFKGAYDKQLKKKPMGVIIDAPYEIKIDNPKKFV